MHLNHRLITTVTAILFSLAANSLKAYTLPNLPAMPATPAPQAANSMPMGNADSFAETNMDFAIETNGPFAPTWTSIAANVPGNGTPAWLRQAKFGIWFHYGPQANLQSGDWSAQHMYQQGADAYNFHTNNFGHPTTNGYKDVLRAWNPTNYSPAKLAQIFYNAGARFVLVQGVHHDNFDNWNSKYNPWNMMNFGAKRDTMAEWTNALRSLGMRMGVAFHHEYSWWFTQPDFLSDGSGTFAGVPYDAVTATNSAGKWWQSYDTRRLYNLDLHKYSGISTPNQGYWNPSSGIFTNDLDYCHWYATQWALRMLDVVENYDPDFIYTDGNSTQPFSGYATGTGYKCDAMERVIAHYYNRTLERHGQLDTLAVVKFHNGDHIGTTFEGGYSSTIKEDQPWFAEFGIGDWFWRSNISYDNGGTIVYRLLEAISRDGAMMVNILLRPDGSFDNYSASNSATNMLAGVGQWMAIHGEGVYGSRAWTTPTEGSFRFTVGTNGCLYAFYEGIPSAGTQLTIASLAANSSNLAGPLGSVSLLGSTNALVWSQTTTGLVVTLPTPMPSLPSGTAIGLKIGPATAIGSATPVNVLALPGTNQIGLSWYYPSATATFNVKRSLTHGGSYTPVATNLTAMVCNDTNVAPGTLYFYVVTAVDAAGESVNSAEASASLAAAPSTNWLTEDVGAVGATGSFSEASGVFTVNGSGADIWDTADEFRYVFQAVTGDYMLTARVLNMDYTHDWAKAGVMMRETLDASSKHAINFMSPANGVALQQRAETGGSGSGVANTTGVVAPYWVRLVRGGNVFTAFCSADGTNWTSLGSTTISMADSIYLGLAVSSHNDGVVCQAQFDNVSIVVPPQPGTPGKPTAAGGNAMIGLTWHAAANAASYNVKRATTSGGYYTTVATTTATSYLNTGLANGTTYYYVVSSVNALGESSDSTEASATPAALTLSSPWSQADVGAVGAAGNGGNASGSFFIQGSGADVWYAADELHFVYLNLTNDCSITARVPYVQNVVNTSKAGVMIRETLATDSKHALVDVTPTTSPGVEFIRRTSTGGGTTAANTTGVTAPYWVRLTRVGDSFTAYRSADGATWTQVGSPVTISMTPNVLVGLAVNSHQDGTLCQAWFDNVSWTPTLTPPDAPSWISATVGDGQVSLSWASSLNATGYNLKRATTNGGTYTVIATNTPGTSFLDTGLTNGTTYYYVASALNPAGESTNSDQASVTPQTFVPTGLSATAVSNSQINLTWNAVTNASSYKVKRSLTNGGSYTTIASVVTTTNYQDAGLAGGTVYYYVVSAVNSGGESTNSVQAMATTLSPTVGSLAHRYSFSDETNSTTVADSVGGPVWKGTLPNGGTFSGGQLVLSSNQQQYVNFPAGIVSNLTAVTIETWVTIPNQLPTHCFLFGFGNISGSSGNSYIFCQPKDRRIAITASDWSGEQNTSPNPSGNWMRLTNLHVTAVFNPPQGCLALYTNGVLAAQNTAVTIPLGSVNDLFSYIGRSLYSGDSYFDCKLNEFRIYNTALSAAEIAATDALGSDQLLSANRPQAGLALTGTNLTVSWSLANAGFTVQFCTNLTLGGWLNVTSPAPQIVSNQWQVALPTTNAGPVFYRLMK